MWWYAPLQRISVFVEEPGDAILVDVTPEAAVAVPNGSPAFQTADALPPGVLLFFDQHLEERGLRLRELDPHIGVLVAVMGHDHQSVPLLVARVAQRD